MAVGEQEASTGSCFVASPDFGSSLPRWLAKTRSWDIEHGGFRSNHLAHNWVVLSAAGAPEEQMQWWLDLYTGRLPTSHARNVDHHPEPARSEPPDSPALSDATWQDHVADSREHYPSFLRFFDRKLAEHGIAGALSRFLPSLVPGLAGAALHPIIHTGWGAEAQHPGVVAEGLAYMAVAYQPLAIRQTDEPLWATGVPGPIDRSLEFFARAQDQSLAELAMEASLTPRYRALGRGGFQHRVTAFDDPELALGRSLNATGPLGLPALGRDLQPTAEELAALMAAAYLGSNCEFFVIHGVTSLHAVLVLLPYLPPEHQRATITSWWRAVMATMTVQGLPGVRETAELLSSWRSASTGPSEEYDDATCDQDWWREALRTSLASRDEHVPKGIYSLWRWTHLKDISSRSRALFARAAANQIRPHPTGELHHHVWMAFDGLGRPNPGPARV